MRSSDKLCRHPEYRKADDDGRKWLMGAMHMMEHKGGDNGRSLEFLHPYYVHGVCDRAFQVGSKGPERLFWCLSVVGLADLNRAALSAILTRLVRSPIDRGCYGSGPVRESNVSYFAALFDLVARQLPQRALEWVLDMANGHSLAGIEIQPATLIRGLILGPAAKYCEQFEFWDLATAEPKFPDRIFSEPGHPDDGRFLSAYYFRAFGDFFNCCSLPAFRRFIAAVRDDITELSVRRQDEGGTRSVPTRIPATDSDRVEIWQAIIHGVRDPKRRALYRETVMPKPEEGTEPEAPEPPA